jgi:adenosylcobyric acid synthase
MNARTLMVQGTASSVGKSLIVTAFCRILRNCGMSVAPFKAQNMALNSFVTPDGFEIGRAQAVQAEAAGIPPAVEMNPILLKPEPGMRSQVVVMGRPVASMSFRDYHAMRPELVRVIHDALARLRAAHDFVVIEGAGSPAEINLRSQDLVNMHVAREADAPVVLAGDIDRGGVFAQFVGTLDLLEPADRGRVAAFLINKFRGDATLLGPGIEYLEERFGIPMLGVAPFIADLKIADEDSVALENRRGRRAANGDLDIAVIQLPHISNYDDFLPLEHERGVCVRFVRRGDEIGAPDLLIIPGTKSTVADLAWMRASGLADAVVARARRREPVIGICGGCQMLGRRIDDPYGVESAVESTPALGLLPIATRFAREKRTAQVRARAIAPSVFTGMSPEDIGEISGYEIHMGGIERDAGAAPCFEILRRNSAAVNAADGAIAGRADTVAGTMIHGIFDNDRLRARMLAWLGSRRGDAAPAFASPFSRDAEYDRLASVVRENINWPLFERIAGLA